MLVSTPGAIQSHRIGGNRLSACFRRPARRFVLRLSGYRVGERTLPVYPVYPTEYCLGPNNSPRHILWATEILYGHISPGKFILAGGYNCWEKCWCLLGAKSHDCSLPIPVFRNIRSSFVVEQHFRLISLGCRIFAWNLPRVDKTSIRPLGTGINIIR